MLANLLARTPDISHLEAGEARLAAALRLWVMTVQRGRCPLQAVADRLDSGRAAAHLHLLLEGIAAVWPDPFCIAPPCCSRLSHDEALLLDMVRLGGRGNRPAFDRLLQEMVPADMRDRLYLSAGQLGRIIFA